jgi:hypothetical protein
LSLWLTGRVPIAHDSSQAWDAAPLVKPLTVRDFEEFCRQHGLRIVSQIYLAGSRRIPVRRDKNLRATIAIFELK